MGTWPRDDGLGIRYGMVREHPHGCLLGQRTLPWRSSREGMPEARSIRRSSRKRGKISNIEETEMESYCINARQSNRNFLRSKWLKDKELRINVDNGG